jgi:hypothetical protein
MCDRYLKYNCILILILLLNRGKNMKDSKGNEISIGDRVKVLWGFDNKIYTGRITRIKESVITIATPQSNISTNNHLKITKIP